MQDLFDRALEKNPIGVPLADLCRPESIDDVVGQPHLLGKGMVLRESIETGELFSMILWGPPGSGKTTIASVIAATTGHIFVPFSAVMGGVKDVRAIVARARDDRKHARRKTILFVDEIHRFNKAQQDAFLPHVEKGTIILVGATTENPSFALISPLLSRSRVLLLRPLGAEDIRGILGRALRIVETRSGRSVEIPENFLEAIARGAEGDARKAINTLEIIIRSVAGNVWEGAGEGTREKICIGRQDLDKVLGENPFFYDRGGEEHYNTISAFIKSLRGSDPDAAVYYMARMLEGGDDPAFILRRMLIFSAEDIGLADPQALLVAAAAATAFDRVGLPEGVLPLTEAALYLATAPKSNSVLRTFDGARAAVKEKGPLPIPMKLRNPVTELMREIGYGEAYAYPHDRRGHWVPETYLPDELAGREFYHPSTIGYEKSVAQRVEKIREFMKAKRDGKE
jgi:putative ATPase